MIPFSIGAALASIFSVVSATGSSTHSSTLTPPVLPLIVRNPYLSTWLANARDEPWGQWPMFWTGEHIGFSVLASIPKANTVYPLLGRPQDSLRNGGYDKDGYNISYPTYLGAKYDASTTNLTYRLPSPYTSNSHDHVEIVLSFLSPITPQSTLRQALPAAYLSVLVEGSFDIDLYVDVNGQWVSGDRGSRIEWEFVRDEGKSKEVLKSWKFRKQEELLFTEINDRAEWGTLHFTGPSDVHHQCGTSALLRQQFAKTGVLKNEVDGDFRGILDEEPVFGFSRSFRLGNGSTNPSHKKKDSVMFTIAHTQEQVVQYASARGSTAMRPLWQSWFFNYTSLIRYHYDDFHHASILAWNYTEQLTQDAFKSGSTNYTDIVALSARQVLGATSFSGTPDNPLIFLKEISSNGNCQTVDVIFPAFPFFLYTNPRWGAYLLEPLLEHQLSGQYPNKYSMHDLGYHFPNQTGHADGNDEYMPVEECGDMLIMGLALVNSLRYGNGWSAQSMWSSSGDQDYHVSSEESSAFPLTSLSVDNGIAHIDDSWGGGAKGDKQAHKWIKNSYRLWRQWTGYLVEFSLEPHNQLCTDDFAGWLPLQTNLALKGIIGIKAMSELASVAGEDRDAKYFQNISETYVEKWEAYGMAKDRTHAKLAYNWYGSWTTLYSLFADSLLCFHPSITGTDLSHNSDIPPSIGNEAQQPMLRTDLRRRALASQSHEPKDFIPHHIYTNQSSWYTLSLQKYGLPLDSRHLYTKSDWQFSAAAVASPALRKEILDRVALWVNETETDRPFSDLYETEGRGGFPGPNFMARPVVGGHFAFLALERACGGVGKLGRLGW